MFLSNIDAVAGNSEIVEVKEECNMNEKVRKHNMSRQGRVYSVEDDINQLFDSVNIKTSMKGKGLQRNPMKKPIRVEPPQDLEIGISETVNLKQALRGLCISQASEMAALKKRTLKPRGSSGVSDVGPSNQFHKTIVVHAKESGPPTNEGQKNILEIAFPGQIVANLSETMPELVEVPASTSLNLTYKPSTSLPRADISKKKIVKVPSQDKIVPLASESTSENSSTEQVQKNKLKLKETSQGMCTIKNVLEVDDSSFANTDKDQSQTNVLNIESCQASGGIDEKMKNKSSSPRLMKPVFWNKNLVKRKIKAESEYAACKSHAAKEIVKKDLSHSATTNELVGKANTFTLNKNEGRSNEKTTPASNSESATKLSSSGLDARVNQLLAAKVDDSSSSEIGKADDKSRSRAKGELSHSSKSSIGEFSSSTSDESSSSGSSRCCNRPHMSKDARWEAIHCVQRQHGFLSLRHFKLLRRLGSGDIGTVYLAELVGTKHLFALKVMDNEFLTRRKKLERAQTEREILQMLDHPFLPTLYSHFVTDKLSCLVMEYCPGGDLHAIRQKQQNRCFSEHAARFYCAEVLLALEYLHMLGIVYRDLKPENILVREDGHIMLSDFDLSLRSVVNPTLFRSSSPIMEPAKISTSLCSESSCIDPFCVQSSWQMSCFTPRLLTAPSKTRKQKSEQAVQVTPLPQLVAEPTEARSHSFVGTHEYLAPEIVQGEGHGSAVDWWTFGIFLYELLYGKTPFKGSSNEETLANVVSLPLRFPETPLVSFHAKDLVRGLLNKQPQNRVGFVRGAAEVKQHPFFEGLNWALIRCAVPPERPKFRDVGKRFPSSKKHAGKSVGVQCSKDSEFELF